MTLWLAASFQSCAPVDTKEGNSILTTTSMSADMLRTITPASIRVDGLMGPGTDPHLYKPTVGEWSGSIGLNKSLSVAFI